MDRVQSGMDTGYTREQAVVLTGLSINQIDRLNRSGVVKPTKTGEYKRSTVLYSEDQLVELRAIKKLKDLNFPDNLIHPFIDTCRYQVVLKYDSEGNPITGKQSIWSNFDEPLILVEDTINGTETLHVTNSLEQLNINPYFKGKRYFIIVKSEVENWLNYISKQKQYISPSLHVVPPLGKIKSEVVENTKKLESKAS